MTSQFWTDNEWWTVQTAINTNATWSATSTGNLNFFIYGGDFDPTLNLNNNVLWYFLAPPKFLGDHGYAYGGHLSFWLGSFAGDFINSARVTPWNFITLRCETCANAYGGTGVYLSQRYVNYTGGLQFFNFTLDELPANGWFKDPKTNLISVWPSPNKCEFIQVLMGLSSIQIYADVTTGFEVIGLDAFTFQTGPTGGGQGTLSWIFFFFMILFSGHCFVAQLIKLVCLFCYYFWPPLFFTLSSLFILTHQVSRVIVTCKFDHASTQYFFRVHTACKEKRERMTSGNRGSSKSSVNLVVSPRVF